MTKDLEYWIAAAEAWIAEYGEKYKTSEDLPEEARNGALEWIYALQKYDCNLPCPRCGQGVRRSKHMPFSNYADVRVCMRCFKEENKRGNILKINDWAFNGMTEIIWVVGS
ncbi:MAG: hypothetical protein LBJ20_03625 [Candidatus Methanoplasma sp.]|jgi:hypothetical protein|nr:hypothetical protein [Candidatus Methanoplasma sp.]